MGEVKGYLKYDRIDIKKQPVEQRIKHFNEFNIQLEEDILKSQGARCMDCGTPFCHSGCPIGNIIPDWNDLVYKDRWEDALYRLLKTNNFPEFTGRVCPAPCENSCVLAINNPAVTIKNIELAIIEKAYANGWVKPIVPIKRSGKKVAIIGSGPSGLACADLLNKYGHSVTVYEKNELPGGLLVFGIPEFKLEKSAVKRRISLMEEEGIVFKTGINVGEDISIIDIQKEFEAVVLCGGAEQPRDLPVPGRELDGIHFAMEFLTQQNRSLLDLKVNKKKITAKGKKVVVIGGGDTGSDCIGTAIRQGAVSVRNFELLPKPPAERTINNPWPQWALIERKSSSHEEGCERDFAVMTKCFSGNDKVVKKLNAVKVEFGPKDENGRSQLKEVPGSEFELDADLVLLAMGFTGPVKNRLIDDLFIELDNRGNIKTDMDMMTNIRGIFSAGDMRRGQSLVVWAINEGRTVAEHVNNFLNENK